MKMELHISTTLSLPTSIGTETIAVLGRRGSGKSNTATVLIEELLDAGHQVVLLDPKGEGWGLKARGEGSDGYPIIAFGEPSGDLPLREEHAETLADFVVSSGRSAVLSLQAFESDQSERRFVEKFAARLYRLKSQPGNHTPITVVLEESHLFVPQNPQGNEVGCLRAIQRLVRQGRSFGIGVVLIDQRPASVNKDVLTQLELMICHQLTAPQDRKAVGLWVEAHDDGNRAKEFLGSLAGLKPGQAWVWSPAKLNVFERVTVRRRKTFDSGATPDLHSAAASARPQMAAVDLEALRGQLDAVVEERKANDPEALRKRIKELEAGLEGLYGVDHVRRLVDEAQRSAHSAADERVAAARREAARAVLGYVKEATERGQRAANTIRTALEEVNGIALALDALVNFVEGMTSPAHTVVTVTPKSVDDFIRPGNVMTFSSSEAASRFTGPVKPAFVHENFDEQPQNAVGGKRNRRQRMLDAAVTLGTLGREVTRESVCAWIGVHPRGGSVGEELKAMADEGLITVDRGHITVTPAGVKKAVRVDVRAAVEAARASLKPRQARIFDIVRAAYPGSIHRDAVAEQMDLHPRGGSFGEDIARLVGRGLIDSDRGQLKARDILAGTK